MSSKSITTKVCPVVEMTRAEFREACARVKDDEPTLAQILAEYQAGKE